MLNIALVGETGFIWQVTLAAVYYQHTLSHDKEKVFSILSNLQTNIFRIDLPKMDDISLHHTELYVNGFIMKLMVFMCKQHNLVDFQHDKFIT